MVTKVQEHIINLGIKVVILYTFFMLFSCENNPVKPNKINDFPIVAIESSKPYSRVSETDSHCRVTIKESDKQIDSLPAQIHLRGNSTSNCPKRPFLLKFEEDIPLLDMPSAHSWVLLANYYDKTMSRNALAFYIAENSNLQWTPHYQFVELYFGSEHKGTYQLTEKIEVHSHRVNISSDGWLVEIDSRTKESEPSFRIESMESPIRIHYPNPPISKERLSRIKSSFLNVENVFQSASFTDSIEGWRKYLDEKSWIDWYLVNEIAKNVDAVFFSSCFMYSSGDGKIVIGPVWDYDLAFGNTTFNSTDTPEDWYIRNSYWYQRLFEDPVFASAVKERFAYFYDRRDDYIQFIRDNAKVLEPHICANEEIWHTMGRQLWEEPFYGSYEENVEALIDWLSRRMEWMNNNF